MESKKITISGTGCALADFLYNKISFDAPGFKKYLSEQTGDGGLSPGKLVFTEELEKFSGDTYDRILKVITGEKMPDAFNVGGPSLVSLIHASQMLSKEKFEVRFFGMAGRDDTSRKIFEIVRKTPLNIENYKTTDRRTSPSTDVLSDPSFDGGQGERTFINNIGAAWEYSPELLTADFYNSHIVCFGGTALVPNIHDNLTSILYRAKHNNCITIVNTVFDFRNEKRNPGKPWPLGENNESLGLIDVLIMDCEEALKISGQKTIETASDFFASSRVSSFIITNGVKNVFGWSDGGLFKKSGILQLPVSKKVIDELRTHPELKGDTTGCGDNFAGGIIASVAMQLQNEKRGQFDLTKAISWGIASGGHTCFTVGGTYLEKSPGEKLKEVMELQREYIKQTWL
jgi:sugar/nucleoside kinase (ribokinase family)